MKNILRMNNSAIFYFFLNKLNDYNQSKINGLTIFRERLKVN